MVRIHPGQLFSRRVRTLVAVVCACGAPLGLSGAEQTEQHSPPDSARIRGQVEDAQARFERTRRRLLPYVWSGSSGRCDERIGRLCFYHGARGGEDEWQPRPDPSEIVEARDELLATMAAAAEHVPADEWILGQRIRYLAEAGRWNDAVRLARACGGAASSWCNVLEGFALHGLGRYEMALERFRLGLEAMDPEEARRWRDPSLLLDGKGEDVIEDAAEENAWKDVTARVWTLADPLYLVAGNDRESEHYARWTFSKIHDDARNAWGMRWGDDLEEITLRYGWDRGWEQIRREFNASGEPRVIGHQLPGGKEFVPPGRILEEPSRTTAGAWIPEEKRPRSAHVPTYAPTFLLGVAQVAVFQRGDSIVVAAASELPARPETRSNGPMTSRPTSDESIAEEPVPWPRPALLEGPERLGLFLVDEAGRIEGVRKGLGDGALRLTVPAGGYLVSVEAWVPEEGLAGRIRHGISTEALPDDLATLSDLILLHPGDSLPETLASALPLMRSSVQLKADGRLVLGWEVFGLGRRAADVSFNLSFDEDGEGLFGRIGRWFGFGGGDKPLQIEWNDAGPSEIGPWFRSIEVTIPEVDPGEYVFRLGVTAPGREELVRTRRVEIVR